MTKPCQPHPCGGLPRPGNNFRCQECDEVMPLRDKESHAQLWTDPVKLLEAPRIGSAVLSPPLLYAQSKRAKPMKHEGTPE